MPDFERELDKNTALVIVDVQKGFDQPYWGMRNNLAAESNIARLLEAWRAASMPVVHVRHMSVEPQSPLRPGQEGNEFKDEVTPQDGERVEEKTVNSSFIGTGLEQYLKEHGIEKVVVVGLTTDHCISTTVRMSANLGFTTLVVADATATFDRTDRDGRHYTAEDIHAYALLSLHNEFAEVLNTSEILNHLVSGLKV